MIYPTSFSLKERAQYDQTYAALNDLLNAKDAEIAALKAIIAQMQKIMETVQSQLEEMEKEERSKL